VTEVLRELMKVIEGERTASAETVEAEGWHP
jgi:hypothetical protein